MQSLKKPPSTSSSYPPPANGSSNGTTNGQTPYQRIADAAEQMTAALGDRTAIPVAGMTRMIAPMPSAQEEAEQEAARRESGELRYERLADPGYDPTPDAMPGVSPREAREREAAAKQEGSAGREFAYKVDRGRLRKTVWFFSLLFVRVLAWEVFIRRFTTANFVARGRSNRWRYYAREFRGLAVGMGGVMIKLGQFISSRVDVLPPEITDELAGLQDQVRVVPFDYIKSTVERELGSLEAHYLWFNPEPIAAASFGQVHRAQLRNGERVVVKVQRPRLNDVVQTDLRALRLVARLSMRYGPIRRRADVPALLDEFARVLWEELDYEQEAAHAERFQSMFADDDGIYVPRIHHEHSTRYVLTMEDVTSIKLNDYAALDRAGIDRREVANRLLDCYLRQIFDLRFFHADPHPGNIFIYPIPEKEWDKFGYSTANPPQTRPFYLIFIDFGMCGVLSDRLQGGLRDTIISVITQDAKALVASYGRLGILMSGADTERIEQATSAVFSKIWGLNMNELTNLPFDEVADVANQFSDLIMTMPFQMPQDFIYLSRTVGILSGMCTGLDPTFDPWRQMQPFTTRLLSERNADGSSANNSPRVIINAALKALQRFAGTTIGLPNLANNVLSRAERGELQVQIAPDSGLQQQVNNIEKSVGQLSTGVIFATTTLASTLLYINQQQGAGTVGYLISAALLVGIWLRGRR